MIDPRTMFKPGQVADDAIHKAGATQAEARHLESVGTLESLESALVLIRVLKDRYFYLGEAWQAWETDIMGKIAAAREERKGRVVP